MEPLTFGVDAGVGAGVMLREAYFLRHKRPYTEPDDKGKGSFRNTPSRHRMRLPTRDSFSRHRSESQHRRDNASPTRGMHDPLPDERETSQRSSVCSSSLGTSPRLNAAHLDAVSAKHPLPSPIASPLVMEEEGSTSESSSEGEFGSVVRVLHQPRQLPHLVRTDSEVAEELSGALEDCGNGATECDLAKLRLTTLPPLVPTFAHLIQLSFSDNDLTTLPEKCFDQLQSLTLLNVSQNQLTHLPLSTCKLVSLVTFIADHNRLKALPEGIEALQQLSTAGLEHNDLQEFPAQLCKIANLSQLYLAENERIVSFPSAEMMARWERIQIKINNHPTLMADAETKHMEAGPGGPLPSVDVVWNKIFPDKVSNFIFLGSLRTAQCMEVYQLLNISYVLTAGRGLNVMVGEGMKHLVLPIDDLPGEDITKTFEEAFAFIEEARLSGSSILIHCFAGLSRSVTVTAGYLMKTRGIPLVEAMRLIQEARPAAHPNEGFVRRLEEYQAHLGIANPPSNRHSMTSSGPSVNWSTPSFISIRSSKSIGLETSLFKNLSHLGSSGGMLGTGSNASLLRSHSTNANGSPLGDHASWRANTTTVSASTEQ